MRFLAILLSLDHTFCLKFDRVILCDSFKHLVEKKLMKKMGARIWAKRVKLGPEISFLPFSQVWLSSLLLNCIES